MKAGILDPVAPTRPSAYAPETVTDVPPRPHLVLVPTGPDAVRAARAGQPPLRLTVFGRLVVSFLAAIALAVLLSAFAGALASASASASGEVEQITVRVGQTLSGIAAEHLPELSVRDAVVELQIFNGLSSPQVHAGQVLRIPSP